ncbi:hypothetical protein FQN60_004357, partial [Etheostoma spectabile]
MRVAASQSTWMEWRRGSYWPWWSMTRAPTTWRTRPRRASSGWAAVTSTIWDFVFSGTKASSEARSSRVFQSSFGDRFTITISSQWVQEAEWTEWFDRDDERGSGDWEKVSDLHEAYPDRLCSSPLDIQSADQQHGANRPLLCCWDMTWQQPVHVDPAWHHRAAAAETHDGIAANQTGDVIHKNDKDYGFVCRNQDQAHGLCRNYRVRFLCGKLVRPQASISIDMLSNSSILELADQPEGWGPGDRVVVASTDYSMHQAEEFTLLPCPTCTSNQVKVQGKAQFIHMGEEVDGVDMRAEVGLLSRNILLRGEMEPGCYGNEACQFFDFDIFGGHLKVERGFRAVHISGLELQHMGQQTMGHYPVHFHMNGDVDARGGYDPPTAVKDVVGYDTLGHCYFTEDGPEERNTFDHCLGLMVRAGTLLPSDRDSKMCRNITDGAYPGYVANPRQDCSATSTFWIANPNNNLINCAAAGSEAWARGRRLSPAFLSSMMKYSCFWAFFTVTFVFKVQLRERKESEPEERMGWRGQGTRGTERSTAALEPREIYEALLERKCYCYRPPFSPRPTAGMILDNGVKTTQANDKDKRPFLSLIGARYGPHQDADPFKPRVPALIHHFVAYKNQDHGAWLRGGDVWLDDC